MQLKGKRTYITGTALVVFLALGAFLGQIELPLAIAGILGALEGMFLRAK